MRKAALLFLLLPAVLFSGCASTSAGYGAALMFWHNYGASASDEDFFFTWEDGKWRYSVLGNRSGRQFALCFTPTETGLRISVVCEDGAYYSWTAGQADTVWSDAEYTAE